MPVRKRESIITGSEQRTGVVLYSHRKSESSRGFGILFYFYNNEGSYGIATRRSMTVLDCQELNIGLREDICCCTRVLGVPNYSYIILHTRFFVRYTFISMVRGCSTDSHVQLSLPRKTRVPNPLYRYLATSRQAASLLPN